MVDLEVCAQSNSAPIEMLQTLAENQGGIGRHRCVICAHAAGAEDANRENHFLTEMATCKHGKSAPFATIQSLHESQGGIGRHKCAICAYHIGYYDELEKIETLRKVNLEKESPPRFKKAGKRGTIPIFISPKKDTLSADLRNKRTGDAGELLVLNYEIERLRSSGREDLAITVEHVSKTVGDGLGYDIKSFTKEGLEIHIEVKTTGGSKNTPFFMTANEVEYSLQNPEIYFLYRVFNFDNHTGHAKFFTLKGSVEENFNLIPTQYKVSRTIKG